MGKKTVVFGSFVVDLMGRTPHLPAAGETVKGTVFKMGPGGKGFNQGVAAHKAGADVTMVTKLGRDTFADIALNTMKELGMKQDRILYSDDTETGCALIMVDENTSQNEIVVILGSCNTISDAEVDSLEDLLDGCEYMLTQLETNVSSVERIVNIACKKGVKVILNTAPVQPISDELLSKVDLITPNEVEAEILTGVKVDSEEAADKAAEWFFSKGVKLGFGQNLCQRCDAFNGCATGDKVVRPLAPITFSVVGDTVFKLLLFVLELRELAFVFLFLGFQLGNGFLFFHSA